ncbi:LOW QUALITY PROTEIN: biorientation of chromosomes in cell division protein 1-like 1 [Drosophila sulfurigaster albostrigata]|uniref:LOW QUALITY PROTEIN: biorientation of chromosomes in cell division protein 1-like 1 n=1 Tax=Drosophila sulfurigaster albostrigata TaxID=89887 RepID=UPI002D21E90C|nr:LOW QUALITY PROTEIN: biorientation of chromosomes in cell division protein 1-like 1 [Drosophila sulfurigaster albostrigata]
MDNFVKTLIEEVKSQGVFDEFRFNCCLADVDTKPAYQNVRNRVETAVNDFLAKQHWTPETNKVQLRERLRKHLLDSDVLDKGVDHIVDQVVNPKVATVFEPKIESIAYKYLGIAPPPPPAHPPPRPPLLPAPPLPPYAGHSMGHMNGGSNMLQVETTGSLLPTDLEQISPDSDRATIKSDMKDDSKDEELPPPGVDDMDMDYDDTTSPAFEPASSLKEDLNNGSLNTSDSLKDVKELANDSRDAGASQTSQLSQVSSDSRLTIASTDAQQPASTNNSNIAANMSEEAQMPKFNENSSETHESSGRQLHFDIKQDAITFEGTERHNSMSEQTNGGTQALSIEDAIMSEMKANISDVNSVALEPTPTPPEAPIKTEPGAENNFNVFTDSQQPKEEPEVPEIKPELIKLEEAKPNEPEALPSATTELKDEALKAGEITASPASASSSSQTKKHSHSSDRKDKDKDKNREKRHHSSSDDKRRKSRERERERERDRDREHDKSRSKTSSSSKHSSRSSHSSSSKHRSSSSSKHDKTSSSSRSTNHESTSSTSKRSSSTRHDSSSSSSHKKHKSSSSSSKSRESREHSHSHNSSHSSHHHSSRSHNGSGSSSSNSKRSDRDRERDRERNKSSSNSTTSNSASNSINPPAAPAPAIIQDDHNEEKAKLQKRHSHDSNDEGKPPGAAGKPQTAEPAVESQTKEKTTNGKATETNGTNGTNGSSPSEAAPEIVEAGNVVIVSDMLQQSTASFIELSSAKPVDEQHKLEAEAKQTVELNETAPEPVAESEKKPESEATATSETASNEPDLAAATEPELAVSSEPELAASTEPQLARQLKQLLRRMCLRVCSQSHPKKQIEEDTKSTDNSQNEAPTTEESKLDSQVALAAESEEVPLESKEAPEPSSPAAAPAASPTPAEPLKKSDCAEPTADHVEAQETNDACTHFEESAEEFKARLQLIEQHIKDRRTLLNVFCGVEEDVSQPTRRNSAKRRLSSEASSSKPHTTSCSSGSSSSGSPNAKVKRPRMSPTPSEISVNSKENEELDKHDKGDLSARRLSQKLCQQQRYTNDDLYKPRPLLSQRSRRRGLDAIL